MKPYGAAEGKLLNGWKEIASYLGRGIRTVQRWELELQLPVRRPRGKSRSAVTALTLELDEWVLRNPTQPPADAAENHAGTGMRVLVVEDNVRDLNNCVGVLKKLGVGEVDVASSVPAAILRLKDIHEGKLPPPSVIILDLCFQNQSGFEVLRYRKMYPQLRDTQIIVWTALPESERQLCDVFDIRKVVPKYAGPAELELALRSSVTQQQPALSN